MVNSGFVVINNGHDESVCLVSSLCFNHSPGCGSHIRCSTHGWPKVSFHFQSCLLVNMYRVESSFISLAEPNSF